MLRKALRLTAATFLALLIASTASGGTFDIQYGTSATVVTNRTGGSFDPGRALTIALANDQTGVVVVDGQGAVQLESAVTTGRSDVDIVFNPGLRLIPAPSSTGGFLVTGSNVRITNAGFLVDTFVNDQVVVEVRGRDCELIDPTFEVTATSGTGANPLTLVKGNGAQRLVIHGMKSHPNAGVRAVHLLDCLAPEVSDFYAGPVSGTTARDCWRVIDIDGGNEVLLSDVRVKYLGSTASPLAHVIRAYENDYAAGGQIGDRYVGLNIASTACRTLFHAIGRKEWRLYSSRFYGANTSVLNTNNYVDRFDAAVLIDNVDEEAVADNDNEYAAHFAIHDCEFDGVSGMGASDIYVRSCAKGEISNTRHVHFTGRYAITIDGDHSMNVQVNGGYFDGQYHATNRPTQYHPILVINRLAEDVAGETVDSGQNGGVALWQELENVSVTGAFGEGWLLTLPALSGGYGVFPPTIGVRGSYWPMGVDGYETYVGSTSISFTGPATVSGTGLFGGVSAGDYVMILGPTNEENWGVRRVQAAAANSLTLFNPNYQNNSDPTIQGTALTSADFTSLAFGDGTGVITAAGGDWSSVLKQGMFLTIASSEAADNANDLTVPAMITAVTATTVTLQGASFASDSGDVSAVLTPSNGGWSLVNESAGATVEVFVFKRGISEIGFARPLSTNIAGRRIR